MSETSENPTTPTITADPPPPANHGGPRPNRLYQALAWVGIVAGVVFIVAVVFFSGFALGKHSGAGYGHFGSHQGRGVHFFHHSGPPPMGQFRPRPGFGPMGPGGPMGPSGMGPGGPSSPASPTTTPAARP